MRNNPFPIEAWFEKSLTLTFAVPIAEVAARLPAFLEADTFQERWAFLAVAMVDTRALRPQGFPRCFGRDFFLIGYRYFVRYRDLHGRNLRGLYILRSETNRRSMEWLGNRLTPYRYVRAGITMKQADGHFSVESSSGLSASAAGGEAPGSCLPESSPFADDREARRFCGPMPFTFSHDLRRGQVLIVEGIRSNWHPQLVRVDRCSVPFLAELGHGDARLASAFLLQKIPYAWKRGRSEPWPR